MATNLTLDDGVLELNINGNGLLRFNPSDPNVYQRFMTLYRALPELEGKYTAQVESPEGDELAATETILERMKAFDGEVKNRLGEVFGRENDFDALLGGVNLMAVGRNGQRIITNLLTALTPYLDEGVKQHQKEAAVQAVAEARENRAQRRAK